MGAQPAAGSAALHECLPPELWHIPVATSGDQGERMGVFDDQLHELMEEDPEAGTTDPASGSHAIGSARGRKRDGGHGLGGGIIGQVSVLRRPGRPVLAARTDSRA